MDSKLLIGIILLVGIIIFILVFALKRSFSLDGLTASLYSKLSTVKCITPADHGLFDLIDTTKKAGDALINDRDPKNYVKPSSKTNFTNAYNTVDATRKYILANYKDCTDHPCSGHGTIDPTTKKCVCNIGYNGDQCQNEDTPCHGLGRLLPNGNCNYLCSAVYPRCTDCTGNINQSDINNVKCTSTLDQTLYLSDTGLNLFDPDACVSILDKPPGGVYGCPIKQDATAWTQYTGSACHLTYANGGGGPSSDRSACVAPATICNIWDPIAQETADYCHAGDFTQIPFFNNLVGLDLLDLRGLAPDKSVSGLAGWIGGDEDNYGIAYPDPKTTPFDPNKYPVINGQVCTPKWNGTFNQAPTNYWGDNSCLCFQGTYDDATDTCMCKDPRYPFQQKYGGQDYCFKDSCFSYPMSPSYSQTKDPSGNSCGCVAGFSHDISDPTKVDCYNDNNSKKLDYYRNDMAKYITQLELIYGDPTSPSKNPPSCIGTFGENALYQIVNDQTSGNTLVNDPTPHIQPASIQKFQDLSKYATTESEYVNSKYHKC